MEASDALHDSSALPKAEEALGDVTSTAQTRFCFYEAQDVPSHVEVNGNSERINGKFQFNQKMSGTRKTIPSTNYTSGNEKAIDTDFFHLDAAGSQDETRKEQAQTTCVPSDVDSIELLRSLQEHQNHSIDASKNDHAKESNPYEDAIKEALQLLRKHRTSATDSEPTSAIDSFRPEDKIQEDAVIRARSDDNMKSPDLGDVYQEEIETRRKQRQERMARYANRLAELKVGTSEGNQEEISPTVEAVSEGAIGTASNDASSDDVPLGVEKVLLAILDRAHSSRGRPVRRSSERPDGEVDTSSAVEPDQPDEPDNALVQAMSELLRQSSSEGSAHEEDTAEPASTTSEVHDLHTLATQDSDPDRITSTERDAIHHPASLAKVHSKESKASSLLQHHDELDKMVEEASQRGTRQSQGDEIDKRVREVLKSDGSLEKGYSTGLTPSASEELSERPTQTSYQNNPNGPQAIFESISAAAKSMISAVDNEGNSESSSPSESDLDSYSSSESDYSDDEMADLMHTLCAHLLMPLLSTRRRKVLRDKIPAWDESNPDEPGYRIIRLNADQLDQVEEEFMDFTQRLQQGARDEKAHGDVQKVEAQASKSIFGESDGNAAGSALVDKDNETLEHFPGVKVAGKGEMGDLEFFQLPIIFKSHVTGFEPTKDMHLESGNVVAGQYLVEGELGSAAFSTAYRCIDLSSDNGEGHEEVCLKVIKNTKDFFDQSLDEIKILELLRQTGKCHDNNILEMKTFFYHREHLIIVTELLRQNLFEFGKFITDNNEKEYFTLPRLSYITRQTLVALDFIHQIGLVHSDVKPENILLSSYSRAKVKLIDFGSSCYLTDRQSSYIQSRSYRAPEVVLGLPYDGRIDIWSLGCVVAEMFTGEVTFQNDSVVSMLSRIEGICGTLPKRMTSEGRQSATYYTRTGLLYEKAKGSVDDDSYSDEESSNTGDEAPSNYNIYQPKRTTLAARLGCEENLMSAFDSKQSLSRHLREQAIFCDFVRYLLMVDPEKRPTANAALKHPWMDYANSLSERDVKYP